MGQGRKQCASSVLGLANQIKRVFDTTTGRCGTQIRILNFVLVSYPDREIYQKDIEEELNIRSASVSTLLKKMEVQNFIRREKVSYDDRLKKILPTSHTVEMKEQVKKFTWYGTYWKTGTYICCSKYHFYGGQCLI